MLFYHKIANDHIDIPHYLEVSAEDMDNSNCNPINKYGFTALHGKIGENTVDNYLSSIRGHPQMSCYILQSNVFRDLYEGKPEATSLLLSSAQAILKSDVILIPILIHDHWTLGVVMKNQNIIFHLDSLAAKSAQVDSTMHSLMLSLMMELYKRTGCQFSKESWGFVTPKDISNQDDEISCGIHVCLNAFSILSMRALLPIHTFDKRLLRFHIDKYCQIWLDMSRYD